MLICLVVNIFLKIHSSIAIFFSYSIDNSFSFIYIYFVVYLHIPSLRCTTDLYDSRFLVFVPLTLTFSFYFIFLSLPLTSIVFFYSFTPSFASPSLFLFSQPCIVAIYSCLHKLVELLFSLIDPGKAHQFFTVCKYL